MLKPFLGCAVRSKMLPYDAVYKRLLLKHFNCFYTQDTGMDAIWFNRQKFDFSGFDQIIEIAQSNATLSEPNQSKIIRGNLGLFYGTVPHWMKDLSLTQDECWSLVEEYLRLIVQRYDDAVCCWDVMTEAIAYDGNLRKSYWKRTLGADYLPRLYRFMRSISKKPLFYCDFSIKISPKWKSIFRLIKDLQSDDLVHGIAIQLHFNLIPVPPYYLIKDLVSEFHSIGIKVHAPETVVWNWHNFPRGQDIQRIYYKSIVRILCETQVEMIGFWCPFDVYPWLWNLERNCNPGLFDINHHPKPVLNEVLRLFK